VQHAMALRSSLLAAGLAAEIAAGQCGGCTQPAYMQQQQQQHSAAWRVLPLTTIPMSALSFSSTVASSTRFMNWSKPRSTPVTCRFAFSLTAAGPIRG
jgi:hypothetical protein